MKAIVQNAIARLEIRDGGTITSRGTAFLVGHNLILTALHVVADREEALRAGPVAATRLPPLRSGELWLTFPNRLPVTPRVKPGQWDAHADWVLLECDGQPPADIRPLPLATVGRDGDTWETHGFPDAKPDGITVGGSIRDRHGLVHGESAYQLQCDEASAGDGMPVSGLSGAPVVVDGRVVGALRWALLTEKMDLTRRARTTSVAGTLYACPADQFAKACGYTDPLPSVRTPAESEEFRKLAADIAALIGAPSVQTPAPETVAPKAPAPVVPEAAVVVRPEVSAVSGTSVRRRTVQLSLAGALVVALLAIPFYRTASGGGDTSQPPPSRAPAEASGLWLTAVLAMGTEPLTIMPTSA